MEAQRKRTSRKAVTLVVQQLLLKLKLKRKPSLHNSKIKSRAKILKMLPTMPLTRWNLILTNLFMIKLKEIHRQMLKTAKVRLRSSRKKAKHPRPKTTDPSASE